MLENLEGIITVDDAEKKFWSVSLVNSALIWYYGHFVTLHWD